MTSDSDRNLLVGILALQMDFIDRVQLIAAMNAWVPVSWGAPSGIHWIRSRDAPRIEPFLTRSVCSPSVLLARS